MKKLITIVFAGILFASCSQKIGYVDIEEIMKDYQATKDLEANLKTKQEGLVKELDSLGVAFQAKVKAFEGVARRMSKTNRLKKEQELIQEQQMLQSKQQTATQALQKEQQESQKKLSDDIEKFVADYAKKQQFNLVIGTIGSGTVMYGEDKLDITKTVLEALNNDYKAEKK